MKKVDVLQLVASICLLVGSVINILNLCLEIPFALRIATLPLFLICVVLYGIVLVIKIKSKNTQENDDSN